MPSTLCTRLPNAKPMDWAERYLFNSSLLSDWCHEYELDEMYATFEAAGLPYTVQFVTPAAERDDSSWADECLTAAERNSFSC